MPRSLGLGGAWEAKAKEGPTAGSVPWILADPVLESRGLEGRNNTGVELISSIQCVMDSSQVDEGGCQASIGTGEGQRVHVD